MYFQHHADVWRPPHRAHKSGGLPPAEMRACRPIYMYSFVPPPSALDLMDDAQNKHRPDSRRRLRCACESGGSAQEGSSLCGYSDGTVRLFSPHANTCPDWTLLSSAVCTRCRWSARVSPRRTCCPLLRWLPTASIQAPAGRYGAGCPSLHEAGRSGGS